MSLPPLATVADLEARGVTVAPEEVEFVNTSLATASAVIRTAAGAPISETVSTVTLEGDPGRRLLLPGLPVQSVSAVAINGTAVTDWVLRSGALIRAAGWQSGCEPSEVTVSYVHGLPEVPEDIVDMVCRMAGQSLAAFRGGDALAREISDERIGDYAVKYAGASEAGPLHLTRYQRDSLAARFGNGARVVRSW